MKLKSPSTIAYVFLVLLFSYCTSSTTVKTKHIPQVIAYYSGDGTSIQNYDLEGVDQLIYSFLHLKGNELALDDVQDSISLQQLTGLKTIYPELKVLISLGGWGGCKTCSEVFNTPEGRKEFAASTAQIIADYNADGIDLDWEYPVVQGPPGHLHQEADRDNFTKLLLQLRQHLPKKSFLSFAACGFPEYLERAIDWEKVMPLVDYVNLMSYDMVGGYSKTTGHHTPLYYTPTQIRSADQAIQYLINHGVPSQKIIIGAAFYGRIFENVPPMNQGLYQSGNFKRGVNQIHFDSITQNFQFYWDDIAKAPYAYDSENQLFLTYDNKRSIVLKTEYAKKEKLGGIMFWQLMNDKYQNGLLKTLVTTAKGD